MFTLVTGKPGASKTSHILAILMKIKDRPIYFRGIKLSDDGRAKLGWHELDDKQAESWPDHVPDAAIVIIDEAQQIFPVRPSSRPVPPGLTALETHRHRGLDIWFISQDPMLLDSHARKICNEHLHFSRPFGAPFVIQYHSGSGFVNPANKGELSTCIQTKKALPREVWALYKSAEIHTHKFRPPKVLFLLILLPILAAILIAYAWSSFTAKGESDSEQHVDSAPVGLQSMIPRMSSGGDVDSRKNMTWDQLLTPEIETLPWTAPIYREKAMEVQSVPRLAACMQIKKSCKCFTQKGTLLPKIPYAVCNSFVKNGHFDHMIPDSPDIKYQLQSSENQRRYTSVESPRAAPAQAHGEPRASAVLVHASSR